MPRRTVQRSVLPQPVMPLCRRRRRPSVAWDAPQGVGEPGVRPGARAASLRRGGVCACSPACRTHKKTRRVTPGWDGPRGRSQGLEPVGKGQAAWGFSVVCAAGAGAAAGAAAFFAGAAFLAGAAAFFAGAAFLAGAAAFLAGAAAFFAGAAAFLAGAAAFLAGAAAFLAGAAAFFAGAAAFLAGAAAFFAGAAAFLAGAAAFFAGAAAFLAGAAFFAGAAALAAAAFFAEAAFFAGAAFLAAGFFAVAIMFSLGQWSNNTPCLLRTRSDPWRRARTRRHEYRSATHVPGAGGVGSVREEGCHGVEGAGGQSQDRAPPDWYSMTRVSKKLRSFFRSIISLIQGNGFSSFGKSASRPIWVARRLAM